MHITSTDICKALSNANSNVEILAKSGNTIFLLSAKVHLNFLKKRPKIGIIRSPTHSEKAIVSDFSKEAKIPFFLHFIQNTL